MSHKQTALFSDEKQSIESQVHLERLVNFGIGGVAIASLLIPLSFAKNLDRESKLFTLLLSNISAFGLVASLEIGNKKEKIFKSFEAAQLKSFSETFQIEVAADKTIKQLEGQREIAYYINTLPEHEQRHFGEMYGVTPLIPPIIRVQQEETEVIDRTIELPVSTQQLQAQLERTEADSGIDLSWLDSEFIIGSKVVVGARKSGKSQYLRYEAARYFIENPTSDFFILDPHFNPNEVGEKQWLDGIPSHLLKNYVVKSPKDIFAKMVWVEEQLLERIRDSRMLPDVGRIKIILDEEENIKRNLPDDLFEKFQDILSLIQDEGRKYGIDITIAMHSLKKENTGIDSANLQQMDWLLFHKSAYDSTTRYPSDFDQAKIKKTAKALCSQINPKEGRVIVVVKQEEADPLITILPLIESPIISLKGSDTASNAIQRITDWYSKVQQQLNRDPNDEELGKAWEQLTNETLTDTAIKHLRERILEGWNPNVSVAE